MRNSYLAPWFCLLSVFTWASSAIAQVDSATERPARSWKPVAWGKVVTSCSYQPGINYAAVAQVRCPWHPVYYRRVRSDLACPLGCVCVPEDSIFFALCNGNINTAPAYPVNIQGN